MSRVVVVIFHDTCDVCGLVFAHSTRMEGTTLPHVPLPEGWTTPPNVYPPLFGCPTCAPQVEALARAHASYQEERAAIADAVYGLAERTLDAWDRDNPPPKAQP